MFDGAERQVNVNRLNSVPQFDDSVNLKVKMPIANDV